MNTKLRDSIFADIALFLGSVEQRIVWAETEPLNKKIISKRHTRILTALAHACEVGKGWVHADLKQIRELVGIHSCKKYSQSDISAFTFDLAKRGYVNHVKHEEYGDVFAIVSKGIALLEAVEALLPSHFEMSKTPNFYFGVRH